MKKKAEKQATLTVQADSLRAFMERRGLKPHPWAQKAGLRSSTIYNLLAGKSHTLSSESLRKLAHAAGATVDELLGIEPAPRATPVKEGLRVPMRWIVGAFGRLHHMEETALAPFPPGVATSTELEAARIDTDVLRPIPGGWILYFEKAPRPPQDLLGTLAVVRVRTSTEPLIREIRRGSTLGLYSLMSLNSAPIEDAEIVSAHRVVAFLQAG